ncbi:helix-turn-helix transcriptional regulator [Gilvimarinus chinensis]|uniref:helix-turn-helix transcriptional regulator n=1 Tax=Gilvimarinus chinensis TaxID=396005 RepID=UPI0012F8AD6B|nr:helix-turn-helix domain-containing protein [Gilvimarinus chinensis]
MKPLSHDSLLFNIHDLVLLLATAQYLLLASLLLVTRPKGEKSAYLLAAMLVVSAVQVLDTLLIWSAPLRLALLDYYPSGLFLGSFSYWLQGPLLLGYVTSVLYRSFRFRPYHLLHLVPALVAGTLLIANYYALPRTEQVALMMNLEFMWTPLMTRFVTGWHISVLAYGAASLWVLSRYRRQLLDRYANLEVRQRRWLIWIVLGFMTIALWKLSVHLIGTRLSAPVSNALGIASHYFAFLFVTSLVFISVRYTHMYSGLHDEPSTDDQPGFKPEHVQRVADYMANERPYLSPDVSLESLAHNLSLPERTLSRILNHHYGQNFFEFINSHRIEKAKQLLTDPDKQHLTILEVLNDSGFSSKSTFNAIFKKRVGKTPSQYRNGGN